ncbi:amino acid adenylation domain-containing protein [Legionella sp. km535]|uniref:non-ribosomal peptide synthetase family protein n=1 Tax=Legionella sp. km535 TaxID=2498107 RepID=UPI000F8F00D5|nr:amino acid adenylation domain-containing protein [Legionella sp. km535]RUR17675.1 amino acid adenylation domain-containing protein [Legionella sp. km535]
MEIAKQLTDTISAAFEAQVSKSPHKVAVIHNKKILTYKELDTLANQLAHYVKLLIDINPDDFVAFSLTRSENIIICILAILKAGGAYVPLDPNLPVERINYIISDTKPKLIISDSTNTFKNHTNTQVVILNNELKIKLKTYPATPPLSITQSSNLAYVLYTSGTTGTPKGVMIEHKSYLALIANIKKIYFFHEPQIDTYSITNYVFDIFGLEYGLPLLHGGSVTLGDQEFSFLDCSKYSFIQMTPSFLNLKLEAMLPSFTCQLFIGGEPLSKPLLQNALKKFPVVANLYGPTETTIWSLYKTYKSFDGFKKVTIGTSFDDENIFVLNEQLKPTSAGEIGELFIGGVGLARGYLNQPELTSNKFIHSTHYKNQRLYRTGDLVRKLTNKDLEYIGRNDSQIKIRGHRIELGEIEAVISEFPKIKQTIIILQHHNDNDYLICYYTSDEQVDEQILIRFLKKRIPDYMIPQYFVFLKTLPLTINGKTDRKSLPKVKFSNFSANYAQPKNEIEIQICHIWSEILQIDYKKIGLNDDFFMLGGTSINAIKLIATVNNHYKGKWTITDIYTNSTLLLFTKKIRYSSKKYRPIIKFHSSKDDINKSNMYLIHPGAGGCEVYTSLANMLKDTYDCYGIESYNLYNKTKITTLNKLANKYLKELTPYAPSLYDNQWNLLGWSLGGQIAMEMAVILEKKGYTNINVFLLDTILNDHHLLKLRQELNIKPLIKEHQITSIANGYHEDYVKLLTTTLKAEHKLICQNISGLLSQTKVYLFKAELSEETKDNEEQKDLFRYMTNLPQNNIELFIKNRQLLNVFSFKDINHNNILNEANQISKVIKEISHINHQCVVKIDE